MVIVVTLNSRYCTVQTHSEWISFLMQLSFLIKLIRHLEGLLFCLNCIALLTLIRQEQGDHYRSGF